MLFPPSLLGVTSAERGGLPQPPGYQKKKMGGLTKRSGGRDR